MARSIDLIVDLNKQIEKATLDENFSRVLLLDTKRRELIQSLATNADFKADELSLNILKTTAEKNQTLINEITTKMTELTRITGGKIKMLRSYRKTF
jgi:hypothetical protein